MNRADLKLVTADDIDEYVEAIFARRREVPGIRAWLLANVASMSPEIAKKAIRAVLKQSLVKCISSAP
jgi:hypothetical protein